MRKQRRNHSGSAFKRLISARFYRLLRRSLPSGLKMLYALIMEFKIVASWSANRSNFDLELAPGAVDFGDEAEQMGDLATSGRAEVIHEHRGPKDIVADIRLRGRFAGKFQVPCARCIEPVEIPLAADFDLIFRPIGADSGAARAVHYSGRDRNRLLSKRQSVA